MNKKFLKRKILLIISAAILAAVFILVAVAAKPEQPTQETGTKAVEDDTSGLFDGIKEPSIETWCEIR